MSTVAFISKKLSISTGKGRLLSPAIVVSATGVAVAFMVMMLSIAVVGGFKHEITRKIMGFDAQVSITPLAGLYGDTIVPMQLTPVLHSVIDNVAKDCGVKEGALCVSAKVSETGLLKTSDSFAGVQFEAFSNDFNEDFLSSVIVDGEMPLASFMEKNQLVISKKIADRLGLAVGDKVDAFLWSSSGIRQRKPMISGIYSSGFSDYDELVVFAALPMLRSVAMLGGEECVSVVISGLEKQQIEPFAANLQQALTRCEMRGEMEAMAVNTVLNSGAVYFNWLALLDTNVVVILILMACVSGFMLITCVLILILQRVRMIGILKTLGCTNRTIMALFMTLGLRVVTVGLLLGNAVSLAIIFVQRRWHLIPLDPDSYYLASVPMEFVFTHWLLLNVVVVAFLLMLILLPCSIISRLSPVKVLRFE